MFRRFKNSFMKVMNFHFGMGVIAATFSMSLAADEFDNWNSSAKGKAYRAQMQSTLDVPFSQASLIGSHNSYSTDNDFGQANQHGDVDVIAQLKLGHMTIELDVYWYEGKLWLCHANCGDTIDYYLGSYTNYYQSGTLWDHLEEIRQFLAMPEYKDQVVLLQIEDHAGHRQTEIYNQLVQKLGDKIYNSNGCKAIPANLSPRDILDAGKRVVVWRDASDCSNHSGFANMAYSSLGNISRAIEDQTGICETGDTMEDIVNGITLGLADVEYCDPTTFSPADIALQHEGGLRVFNFAGVTHTVNFPPINLLTLDFIVTNDARRFAGIWSWLEGYSDTGTCGRLVTINSNGQDIDNLHKGGRWLGSNCGSGSSLSLPYACFNGANNEWQITGSGNSSAHVSGTRACQTLGAGWKYIAPGNAVQNKELSEVMDTYYQSRSTYNQGAWINVNRDSVHSDWKTVTLWSEAPETDAPPSFISLIYNLFL